MKLNNTSENHLVYQYHQHFYQMYVCVHNNGVHHDAQDTNLLKLRIQKVIEDLSRYKGRKYSLRRMQRRKELFKWIQKLF